MELQNYKKLKDEIIGSQIQIAVYVILICIQVGLIARAITTTHILLPATLSIVFIIFASATTAIRIQKTYDNNKELNAMDKALDKVVAIKFDNYNTTGKMYYFKTREDDLQPDETVIVLTKNGLVAAHMHAYVEAEAFKPGHPKMPVVAKISEFEGWN